MTLPVRTSFFVFLLFLPAFAVQKNQYPGLGTIKGFCKITVDGIGNKSMFAVIVFPFLGDKTAMARPVRFKSNQRWNSMASSTLLSCSTAKSMVGYLAEG